MNFDEVVRGMKPVACYNHDVIDCAICKAEADGWRVATKEEQRDWIARGGIEGVTYRFRLVAGIGLILKAETTEVITDE